MMEAFSSSERLERPTSLLWTLGKRFRIVPCSTQASGVLPPSSGVLQCR